MARVIAIVSGGVESLMLMRLLWQGKHDGYCFFVDYGQRAVRGEKRAVETAARIYGLKLEVQTMHMPFLDQHPIVGGTRLVYEKRALEARLGIKLEDNGGDGRGHVVPYRNLIFLSMAASLGTRIEAEQIWAGFDFLEGNKGAANDKCPAFVDAFNETLAAASEGAPLVVHSPLQGNTKAQTLDWGNHLGVDWRMSWSCYNDFDLPCGVCGSCASRLEGFRELGQRDPLHYCSKEEIHDRWRRSCGERL